MSRALYIITITLITLSLLAGGLLSCERRSTSPKSEYDHAVHLLDTGQYNSAIFIMQERLNKDPEDERARQLLAAGYAGRAGIFLRDFVNFVEVVIDSFRASEAYLENRALQLTERFLNKTSDPGIQDFLQTFSSLLKALYRLEEILGAFDRVPKIESLTAANDLKKAVQILDGSKSNDSRIQLSQENLLYRALLRITVLKYDLRNSYDLAHPTECHIQPEKLMQDTSSVRREVIFILQDLAESAQSDSSKSKILKIAEDINEKFTSLFQNLKIGPEDRPLNLTDLLLEFGRSCP